MITLENIKNFLSEKLTDTDIFIVDISIKPGNRIYVFLDSFKNVTIGDCVKINRLISGNFDREVEDYALEVSSAGLTSAFKVEKQYIKNTGKNVKVKTVEGIIIKGLLKEYKDTAIAIEETTKIKGKVSITEHKIDLKNIAEIKLDINF